MSAAPTSRTRRRPKVSASAPLGTSSTISTALCTAKTAPTAPSSSPRSTGREDQERKHEPDGQPAQRPEQDEVPGEPLAGHRAYSADEASAAPAGRSRGASSRAPRRAWSPRWRGSSPTSAQTALSVLDGDGARTGASRRKPGIATARFASSTSPKVRHQKPWTIWLERGRAAGPARALDHHGLRHEVPADREVHARQEQRDEAERNAERGEQHGAEQRRERLEAGHEDLARRRAPPSAIECSA